MKTEIRTARIDFSDPFAGHYLVIRTNSPMRVYRDLASDEMERTLAGFAAISIEGDLTDEQDQPIDVTSADGWAEMNRDVLAYVATRINEAIKPPKASANGSSTQPLSDTVPSPTATST